MLIDVAASPDGVSAANFNDVRERIAENAGSAGGAAAYVRGLYALARREYSEAISRLDRAEALGLQMPPLRPLLVYALCLDGRTDEARKLARGIRPRSTDEGHFWRWMGPQFGVGPFSDRQEP